MKSDKYKSRAELIQELNSLRKHINVKDIRENKRAGDRLPEREQQLSLIYDSISDVIFYIAVEPGDCFRFQSVNQAFMNATGLTEDQIIGKRIEDVIPEPSLSLVRDNYKKAIEEKIIVQWEETTEYPTGKKIGEVSIAPIFDDKICTHLVGIVHNITEHKQAEEKLRKNEERYRSILENIEEGYYEVDLTGCFTFFNESLCKMLNYSRDELMGMNNREYMDSESAGRVYTVFNDVFKSGKPSKPIDIKIKRKDGIINFGEISISLLKDRNDKPVGFRGIVRDATEKKKGETELLESEKRFSVLSEATFEGIVITYKGKVVDVNDQLTEILGYNQSELIGINAMEFVAPESRESVRKKMISNVEIPYEHKALKKDGTIIDVEVHGKTIHYAGKPMRVTAIRNITERKQAKDALQESNLLLSSIIESSEEVIIFALDKNYNYLSFNKAHVNEMKIAYNANIEIGQNILEFIPLREDRLKAEKTYKRVLKGERFIEIQEYGVSENRSWYELMFNPIFDSSNQVMGITSFITNITERKKTEEKLQSKTIQQKRLLETARRLNTSLDVESVPKQISKEIRTLLHCFGVTIYMLEDSGRILKPIYSFDPPYEKHVLSTNLKVNNSLTGQAVKAKKGMIFNYAEQISGGSHIPGTPVDDDDHVLVMPIIIEGIVNGAITIYRRKELFNKEDLALVETFILYADTALNNARLHQELLDQIEVRKNSEEQLKKAQEYAQNLIDTSMDMIVSVDMKSKIQEFNPAAEKVFGYNREEIVGKHVNVLYADENKGRKIHKTVVAEGSHITEVLNKRKNGETFLTMLAASVLYDKDGEITGIMGVSRDITEQKAAERALRESEERYRRLINIAPLGISIHQKGKWVLVNRYTWESLGYDNEEELLGQPVLDMVHPDYREDTAQRIEEAVRTEKPLVPSEIKILKKDGTVLDSITTGVTINFRGKPAIEVAAMDITELKKVIEEREHALSEAEKANLVKSNFLANMSHEIRTPLNSILGFTDIIENEVKETLNPEMKECFSIIQQSGKRLMNTIHGILDISQIETKTINLNPEQIDLNKIITNLISALREKVKEKQLDIRFDSHVKLSTIHSDLYCVTQALENIIDNAIKYTKKGSISVQLKRKGKRLIAEISDTGIGMSKRFLDRMFDPFTQESEGFSKEYQGIGLGLALTKRYLDLIGAELKVDSKKGKGSTFTILFNNSSS